MTEERINLELTMVADVAGCAFQRRGNPIEPDDGMTLEIAAKEEALSRSMAISCGTKNDTGMAWDLVRHGDADQVAYRERVESLMA